MKNLPLALLAGVFLYLPFSKLNLWFLIFPAIFLFFKNRSVLFWTIGGYAFVFLSLRCANISSIEFGGLNPALSYSIFSVFAFVFAILQFSIPAFVSKVFLKNHPLAHGLIYTVVEWIRSHFPFGGFPWLLLGEVISQVPIFKYSLYFISIPTYTFLCWLFVHLILQKRFLLASLKVALLLLLSLISYRIEPNTLEGVRLALVQTAVPQEDKLSREAFSKHSEQIIKMIEKSIEKKPDLIILPESAFHFFFSEEETETLYRLSLQAPILVGLIDIRENLRPYNSAYLFAEGKLVDYYDKVKLMPIGEFIPKPFEFLKDIFQSIGGIDYNPGQRVKIIKYKEFNIAVPICFEIAHYSFMEKLAKDANIIVVITNDGWFKDSDCTFQHFRYAQWAALRFKKFVVWVNNSGDTAVIDPYGRVVERLGYMERRVLFTTLKLR
ncbi:apolipoprotein N-acyltransferase [Thermocrinis sp.]|uniref:apolipoprotein N-acyltransferase n=1 Tax=Thermocrinis sp. TaxID=2024383 RepID=UPI002FDD029A